MDLISLAPLKCTHLAGIQVEEGQQPGVVHWETPERDTYAQLVTCTASWQLHTGAGLVHGAWRHETQTGLCCLLGLGGANLTCHYFQAPNSRLVASFLFPGPTMIVSRFS